MDQNLLKQLSQTGQHPVATIVSCSDSRVPVEVLFNQTEPGKLFVIRVAGNIIADPSVLGSIEYAILQLKTPYIIILGHTECGAVQASLEGIDAGNIGKLVSYIQTGNTDLNEAIKENVNYQVAKCMEIKCVKNSLDKADIEIYGMFYDIHTGMVHVLSRNGKDINDNYDEYVPKN